MATISAYNIVRAIRNIPCLFNSDFNYINPENSGLFRVISIDGLDGPIKIKRWWPNHKDTKNVLFQMQTLKAYQRALYGEYPTLYQKGNH